MLSRRKTLEESPNAWRGRRSSIWARDDWRGHFLIGKATTFWMGVLGILKALVWPAVLVYEAMKFLIK